jgi:hypothetical protein
MFIFVHQIYIQQNKPPAPTVYSMLELKEFRDLPGEFKAMIRKTMPDPNLIRKQWGTMTSDHKKAVLEKVATGGMIPFPEEQKPMPPAPPPFKKGFLLKNDKKKNPKNKENEEVVALRTVKPVTVVEEGAEEADGLASNDGDTTFLGSDD